ncbi:helicase-related protein [Pleurocapsa sp. PCC 7327]|uniref:helicase-related protein n=1 Tax=Pleurocapsa sp. PCC 7327 TaxID=118163 RepID=UPI0006885B98|nr:helicase-related protein [Pleurocapsa sp. PCC 7327]
MSSPAAAIATLSRLSGKGAGADSLAGELDEELAATYVYNPTEQEMAIDVSPTVVVEQGQQSYGESQKRKLREFVKAAEQLKGSKDAKLQQLIALVKDLLKEGLNPIVWCRYIATANYVAQSLRDELEKKKGSNVRVIAITGGLSKDEREIRLDELKASPQRVMVATDCLSEGVNLQEHFTAAIHYDLPWNPNRLEQREGRIDRYGQPLPTVKCILLYGQDNPVDGAVLEVLIRKAVTIYRTLGITVPVPMDSATVQEAVFKSLFEKVPANCQLSLFDLLQDTQSPVATVHQNWDRAVEREKQNRTRFAQRSIKPEEVERELLESDRILGNDADVEQFVKQACDRLKAYLIKQKNGWYLPNIPHCLIPTLGNQPRLITFSHPAPEGVEYVGRNHPLVEGLARYLLEDALENRESPTAARCGVTVTDAVAVPTSILLLRLRYLLESNKHSTLLAEECLVVGFTGSPSQPQWLSDDEVLTLLQRVEPVDDLPLQRKRIAIERLLSHLPDLDSQLEQIAQTRSQSLLQSHRRVRAMTQEGQVRVKPQLPMDILGVYLFQPL